MKKRINVTDEVYNKLLLMATDSKISGVKPSEKVEKLFNDGVIFKEIASKQEELNRCKDEIVSIKKDMFTIGDEQLKRLEKLQAIGIIEGNSTDAIKTLIDVFVDVKKDDIQKLVLSI